MPHDYDLFVIGAGSGGVRAARRAAEAGARVAIAEADRVGGTCVIRGCIPKKLLVYASQFGEAFEDSVAYGWSHGGATFDWPTLIANKDKEIARLEGRLSSQPREGRRRADREPRRHRRTAARKDRADRQDGFRRAHPGRDRGKAEPARGARGARALHPLRPRVPSRAAAGEGDHRRRRLHRRRVRRHFRWPRGRHDHRLSRPRAALALRHGSPPPAQRRDAAPRHPRRLRRDVFEGREARRRKACRASFERGAHRGGPAAACGRPDAERRRARAGEGGCRLDQDRRHQGRRIFAGAASTISGPSATSPIACSSRRSRSTRRSASPRRSSAGGRPSRITQGGDRGVLAARDRHRRAVRRTMRARAMRTSTSTRRRSALSRAR